MKLKIIIFLFVSFIFIISYSNKKYEVIKDEIVSEKEKTKMISIIYNSNEINLPLEEYVIGVVACEMPASFNIEALKAMAVAARTFAVYKINNNKNYKMKTTTNDQCYISNEKMKKRWGKSYEKKYQKIKKAVYDTKNQLMTYNGKVIIAFYFSISNGYTENCENVFFQKLAYLKSVDSSWDKEYSYKEKTKEINESDFCKKLGIKDNEVKTIDIVRSKTSRAKKVIVNNKEFKGTVFRKLLSLRSTDIDIKIENKKVYIITRGYGHGVGMSQYGANAMAKKGYNYDEILKHYYTGVKITE